MASASLLKTSPVVDKSEWITCQTLRQPSVYMVHCHPVAPSALTVRAGRLGLLAHMLMSLSRLRYVLHCNM